MYEFLKAENVSEFNERRGKLSSKTRWSDFQIRSAADHVQMVLNTLFGTSNWTNLTGMRVLDLGCGGGDNREPWFCRICSANGADVVGVDIQELPPTNYTHIQSDLLKMIENKGHLFELVGANFNIIHSNQLFDSPDLIEALSNHVFADFEAMRFEQLLFQQASEILATPGLLFVDSVIYNSVRVIRQTVGGREEFMG